MIHGDDFVTVGRLRELKKMQARLEQELEIKTQIIGMSAEICKEVKVLNRIIRYTESGIELEADRGTQN